MPDFYHHSERNAFLVLRGPKKSCILLGPNHFRTSHFRKAHAFGATLQDLRPLSNPWPAYAALLLGLLESCMALDVIIVDL